MLVYIGLKVVPLNLGTLGQSIYTFCVYGPCGHLVSPKLQYAPKVCTPQPFKRYAKPWSKSFQADV